MDSKNEQNTTNHTETNNLKAKIHPDFAKALGISQDISLQEAKGLLRKLLLLLHDDSTVRLKPDEIEGKKYLFSKGWTNRPDEIKANHKKLVSKIEQKISEKIHGQRNTTSRSEDDSEDSESKYTKKPEVRDKFKDKAIKLYAEAIYKFLDINLTPEKLESLVTYTVNELNERTNEIPPKAHEIRYYQNIYQKHFSKKLSESEVLNLLHNTRKEIEQKSVELRFREAIINSYKPIYARLYGEPISESKLNSYLYISSFELERNIFGGLRFREEILEKYRAAFLNFYGRINSSLNIQFATLEIKEMTTELEQKTHCVNRCIELHYECLRIPLSQAEIDLLSSLSLQELRQKAADLYQKQSPLYHYTSISETVHNIKRSQKEKEVFFELSLEQMTLEIENLKKKKRFKFW